MNSLLLRLSWAGDVASWAELDRVLRPWVVAFARKRLLALEDAEDVHQDLMLRLRQVAHRFRKEADGRAFVVGVLLNILHESRSRATSSRNLAQRLQQARQGTIDDGPLGPGLSRPEQAVLLADLNSTLEVTLACLSHSLRQAVEFRFLQGLSGRDAARKAGCTEEAFRQRVHRALDELRTALGPFGYR